MMVAALSSDHSNDEVIAMMSPTDFVLAKEVEKEVRLSGPTIFRMQRAGLFPRYFKASPRKNALSRGVLAEWKADPQGWAKRNSEAAQTV